VGGLTKADLARSWTLAWRSQRKMSGFTGASWCWLYANTTGGKNEETKTVTKCGPLTEQAGVETYTRDQKKTLRSGSIISPV